MAARQKKDVKTFFKKLRKRYPNDPAVLSRDRKILEHLVFALFLENATFKQARAAFVELQRYFIDWNEIRVSTANEIAAVIGNIPDPATSGVRLRWLLQMIFDKTYQFELEDFRTKGREEILEFLKSVSFSTSFMSDYTVFFAFGGTDVPLDENSLRVLRLLGYVSVVDGKEVVPCLEGAFSESEAREFFFALHEFATELSRDDTKKDALKFLLSFDAFVSRRSAEPLVESSTSDPREIARLLFKREPRQKSSLPTSNEILDSEMDEDYDEKRDDSPFDDFGAETPEVGEKERVGNNASEEAFITSRTTSYVDNRPDVKEKTKERKIVRKTVKRGESVVASELTGSREKVNSKSGKSLSEVPVEVEPKTKVDEASVSRASKSGRKRDKNVPNGVKASQATQTTKLKGETPLEESTTVKKGTKRTKKRAIKAAENLSKVDGTAKKEKTSSKSASASAKVRNSSANVEKAKEQFPSGRRTKKAILNEEIVSAPSKKTKRGEKKDGSQISTSVRSKVQNSDVALKKTAKIVTRARKVASEPPDGQNVDARKKTAKRSVGNSKGQKKGVERRRN